MKNKNPQASIIFDGLGLVLADDVREAVKKVISILDKARKMGENGTILYNKSDDQKSKAFKRPFHSAVRKLDETLNLDR